MSSRTLFAIAFLLCALVQVSQQRSEELPQAVIDLMASRAMRYHHFLWHNLRENWSYLPATTQHELRKYGWGVDRPALTLTSNGTEVALEDNGSGEEFLWMHRLMIEQVNEIVADTDYERVTGWKNCPYPGDPKWSVPANYTTASDFLTEFVNSRKTDEFFWTRIQPVDEMLHDPDYLRSVSLAKLGSNVEFTVHRDMHLRFSDPGTVGLRAPTRNPTPDIDEKWDDPAYRWLGDTYASHVNPTFWKIHGWVDDHIEAWRKANGLDEVEWTYTWTGGPTQTLEDLFVAGSVDTSGTPDGDEDSDYVHPAHENMEQAVKILLKEDMRNPLKNPFFNEVPVSIRELIKSK